jgi:O-antigen/teichoic acid export membrane protein
MLTKNFQSKFVRNVIVVASGTAGAQAITMAFAPFITRIYGPEAFGLLGTFMAILAVATPIAALTYPIAIVLPKSDDDARGLARLSTGIAFFMAVLLAVIILLAGKQIAELLNVTQISAFLLLIPLAMFFSALQQIMQQWLIRKNQFSVTARVAVSQSLILNSSKIGAGLYNPVGAVLIILATLGSALYAVQLWFGAQKWAGKDGKIIPKPSGKTSLSELAYIHRDFPYYRAPQVFLNAASQSIPVLMLASLFGPASAGFYTLASTVMGVPSKLVSGSVGDVLYPKFAEAKQNQANIYKIILKSTIMLLLIGGLPFGIVALAGPWLFEKAFGLEWRIAGEYARWLSLFFLLNFVNRPSVVAIPVLEMQGSLLVYELFSAGIKIVGLLIGFYVFNSEIIAVALFSITGCFAYALLILSVLLYSREIKV